MFLHSLRMLCFIPLLLRQSDIDHQASGLSKEPAVLSLSRDAAPAKERYQYNVVQNSSRIRLLKVTTQSLANSKGLVEV